MLFMVYQGTAMYRTPDIHTIQLRKSFYSVKIILSGRSFPPFILTNQDPYLLKSKNKVSKFAPVTHQELNVLL